MLFITSARATELFPFPNIATLVHLSSHTHIALYTHIMCSYNLSFSLLLATALVICFFTHNPLTIYFQFPIKYKDSVPYPFLPSTPTHAQPPSCVTVRLRVIPYVHYGDCHPSPVPCNQTPLSKDCEEQASIKGGSW